jgi:5,10-methylenetetrahydromethanopterin reductase
LPCARVADGRLAVGLVMGSQIPPQALAPLARKGEKLGFSEIWLAEDYFFTGGISAASTVLGATQKIPVGFGIVSAMVRHPAVLAMECSTLAHLFPGRLWPGIGLGLPDWIRQMGLYPPSQLAAIRECITSLRALLRGDVMNEEGGLFTFRDVKLAYPVDEELPIYAGVLGPKMLQVSGAVADGTVGSVLASVEYLRWAREQIAIGQEQAGRSDHHRIACFALFSVDNDSERARDALRPTMSFYLSVMPRSPLGDAYGITDELVEMAAGGAKAVADKMPDQWMQDLAVVGNPEECASQIQRLLAAGADSIVLYPMPPERSEEIIEQAAREVLPRLA